MREEASFIPHEGGSHRLICNCAPEAEAASLLFQTDFVGQAKIGPAGSVFAMKTSRDGMSWREALAVNPATAIVRRPAAPAFFFFASAGFEGA